MRAVLSRPKTWRRPDRLHLAALLLPPLAVKLAGRPDQLPLSILLTFLAWVPGVIHAMSIVSAYQAEQQARGLVSALRSHIGR